MTIALTGATGFVGSATLDAALQKGHRIRALVRRDQPARERVEWVRGDLENEAALARLTEGADCVIHVAGLTNTPDPARFEAANVTGTANVIEAMKRCDTARLVFVSSLSAREPRLSAYGASKARAETLVEASGLDWTIVRPPAVYGPRDSEMFELFRAAKWGVVPVPPQGRTSLIHVEDLARLLVALSDRNPATSGAIYEPWDDNPYGYAHDELAQLIGQAVGRDHAIALRLPPAVMRFAAKADRTLRGPKAKLTEDRVGYMLHPDWVCDPKKAPPISLWQALWSGEEGLAQTADWYRDNGWL